MNTATITDRTLQIDGMSGDACVQKVKGALKSVQHVETRSVKVGSATIGADQSGCTAACSAIGTAGYKASESARACAGDTSDEPSRKGDAGSTGRDTREGSSSYKAGSPSGSQDQSGNNAGRGTSPSPGGKAGLGNTQDASKESDRAGGAQPAKPSIAKY